MKSAGKRELAILKQICSFQGSGMKVPDETAGDG
jgi:hypothetical protein